MGMSWIVLLQLSSVLAHGYDGWYQPVPHRPVDIITDVINDLAVRILQQYTAHGNVAFSPTGVGFVLAALYEGSAGRGRQQIADALGLPRDRDITRIGFRDIHRRLRTYLNADGFLGGLTLNQENTVLRPEYEDILRFYGFDLSASEEENGTTPITETPPTTITSGTDEQRMTETETTSATDTTTTPASTVELTDAPVPDTEETSTSSPVELLGMTLSTLNLQDRLTQITSTPSTTTLMDILTKATTLPTTNSQTVTTSFVELPSTITNEIGTVTSTVETTQTIPTTTTIESTDNVDDTVTFVTTTDTLSSTESIPSNGQTDSVPGSVAVTETRSTTVTSTILSDSTTDVGSTNVVQQSTDTTIVTQETTSSTNPATTQVNEVTDGPTTDQNTVSTDLSNNETTTTGEIGSTDSPGTTPITGETATGTSMPTTVSTTTDVSMNQVRRRSVRSLRGYFSSYPDEGIWMQDLGIWKPYAASLSEASVRDSTEISFLVNGCDVSSVTASRYIAVLPFAYFPSLHAVALEFPLDDPRYNILLLMSTDRRDTYRLARDLGGKSLRLLRKQLQPTWVRATIPSFMLRGFVTLTSFLERLGILDVFEPRAADLSPMTPDLGVYARDVQQSIGVNIRNYMKPDRTHSRNGLFERAGPVPFTAVHPFLYFIVDAETSVALIAGRVNDPLNSRIL